MKYYIVIATRDVPRAMEIDGVRNPAPQQLGEEFRDWERMRLRNGSLRFGFQSSERCAFFAGQIKAGDSRIEVNFDPPVAEWSDAI